jgi:D-psicose/D-tagatose/L-ribulose 3-epimerase
MFVQLVFLTRSRRMRKVGIYYAYWTHEWDINFLPFVKKVRNLGFEILEINGGTIVSMNQDERRRLKDEAEDTGIDLTFGIGLPERFDVSSLDENIRKNGVAFMKEMIKAVHDMEGKMIGGTVHSYWPAVFPVGMDNKEPIRKQSIKSMKELVSLAEDLEVILNVEVINRFEQFLINTSAEALSYVQEVDSPSCRILLDTFHMNIEEDSIGEAIRNVGTYLSALHLGETNRKLPGLGRMPWAEIKQALDEIEFDGPLIMEPFILPGGQVGRDIGVYREIIENPDLDALASASAEFVKQNLI